MGLSPALELIHNNSKKYYDQKDEMHNLSHIARILDMLDLICAEENYVGHQDVMAGAVYFHGLSENQIKVVTKALSTTCTIDQADLQTMADLSIATKRKYKPEKRVEQIIHDAHLLEGGEYFLILKSLLTGTLRGQTLEETISLFEQKILPTSQAYTNYGQQILERSMKRANQILVSLKEKL